MILASLPAIITLSLIHIFVNKLKLEGIPRSKWLSVAGGISVTYIFLQAFPELQEIQEHLNQKEFFSIKAIEDFETYLIGLLGLTFFYVLETLTRKSKESKREPDSGEPEKNFRMFWIHVSSFAIYNFIIGYLLLHREDTSTLSLLIYTVAMAFHLVVTDHSLQDHFSMKYRRKGRWVLVTALVGGWIASVFSSIPEAYVGMIFAFIAGGIIMNVLKEELPKERESNPIAFCLGVLFYSLLLIFV